MCCVINFLNLNLKFVSSASLISASFKFWSRFLSGGVGIIFLEESFFEMFEAFCFVLFNTTFAGNTMTGGGIFKKEGADFGILGGDNRCLLIFSEDKVTSGREEGGGGRCFANVGGLLVIDGGTKFCPPELDTPCFDGSGGGNGRFGGSEIFLDGDICGWDIFGGDICGWDIFGGDSFEWDIFGGDI